MRPATIRQSATKDLTLSGAWTAVGITAVQTKLEFLNPPEKIQIVADCGDIDALDTAGAWILHKLLLRMRARDTVVIVNGLRPEFAKLLEFFTQQVTVQGAMAKPSTNRVVALLERIGQSTARAFSECMALLSFIGESARALAGNLAHPSRMRWRQMLFNIRTAGFDALPIVGLLSFLLGVVVTYQGADQLRQYGANIFVADLVGLSMLREFAPLITAIIIAGRSGSAYAAQIGSMAVTEEIDAMRTLGIEPLDLLVLPKVFALLIAMPLLTMFADVLGVFGGMIMARSQLDVGFSEFLDRFVKAVNVTAFLIGICKAPVFAFIIATVGCFQGFRTAGGADSVGRQTTRSVVQSIFLVIVADALLSVAFSALGL